MQSRGPWENGTEGQTGKLAVPSCNVEVSREARALTESRPCISGKSFIPGPAFGDERVWQREIIGVVVKRPLPHRDHRLRHRQGSALGQLWCRHGNVPLTFSGTYCLSMVSPPLAIRRGGPVGTAGYMRIDSSRTARVYWSFCTLNIEMSCSEQNLDLISSSNFCRTRGCDARKYTVAESTVAVVSEPATIRVLDVAMTSSIVSFVCDSEHQ